MKNNTFQTSRNPSDWSLDTINLMSKILQCEGSLPASHLGIFGDLPSRKWTWQWKPPFEDVFPIENGGFSIAMLVVAADSSGKKPMALVMVRETSVAPDVALSSKMVSTWCTLEAFHNAFPQNQKKKNDSGVAKIPQKSWDFYRTHTPTPPLPYGWLFFWGEAAWNMSSVQSSRPSSSI